MWVRGLKPSDMYFTPFVAYVAPHVGAWIETRIFRDIRSERDVAPHVGAWIETVFMKVFTTLIIVSRTPCGCVD